jgi:hypothetical protein
MSEKDNSQLENEGNEPTLTDEEIDAILKDDPKDDKGQGDLPDEVKKEIERKNSIIRQLTARVRKAENKPNLDTPPIKKDEKKEVMHDDRIVKTVEKLELAERKREFGYENGLSPAETDHIFKINPNPTKELLEDPFVKGGLQALRAKKRVEDNTPSNSQRSPTFQLPKKADMTPDEKQQHFEQHMKNRLRR